ncbi:unnamed protein product [Calypogeia fissa]
MPEEGIPKGLNSEAHNECDGLSMAEQSTEEPLQKRFAMVGGDGDESYGKNSELQASYASEVRQAALSEALERVTLPSEGRPVIVADLGSSSGPNAVNNVVLIVEKLRHRLPQNAEFQAFFNDLPSTDFNTLFQHICKDPRAKNVFATGLPGSFYGRLFPQSSVHVFHTASCLHWLSEIPHGVLSKDFSANGRANPPTKHPPSPLAMQAPFKEQAALDLKNFLLARAAELVPGGLLFMLFGGRLPSEPKNPGDKLWVELHEIFSDLVQEGLLTQQQQDTFRFPVYHRRTEDLREAIASCTSLFSVLTAKMHEHENNVNKLFPTSKPSEIAKKIMTSHKAVFNSIFEAHIGKEVTEIFWKRYEKLAEKKVISGQDLNNLSGVWVVSLIRK